MDLRNLANNLGTKFGYGDIPTASRRLYQRIEHEVRKYGDPVYLIVCEVVQAADQANSPGKWFRASVQRRLKECGYLSSTAVGDGNESGRITANARTMTNSLAEKFTPPSPGQREPGEEG